MKESAEAWRKEDVWSVVVSLSLVQVALFVESTAEDDAAPAQSKPSPRKWFFGDAEYSGKQRDLENPLVVGTTTRRKPCTCIYTTPRGERLRQCLETIYRTASAGLVASTQIRIAFAKWLPVAMQEFVTSYCQT